MFREIYRVLRPGGRLAIADIISLKKVPDRIRKLTKMWVSCIAGALEIDECKQILSRAGFCDIEVKPEHYYTKDVLIRMADDQTDVTDVEWEMLDRAFAGAFIKAKKCK